MFKSVISFILLICQFIQSLFAFGGAPAQNEGIDFESIKSAVIAGEYALGDEDPMITIELENTVAVNTVDADMFELTDLFAELEITEVTSSGKTITLFTDGIIPFEIPLIGGVNISPDATEAALELRAESELLMRNAYIKQDSFALAGGALSFTLICLNGTFALTDGDVLESDGLAFTVKSSSADGSAVTLTVPTGANDLDSAIAQVNGKELLIPADKLSSGVEQIVMLCANEASLGAKMNSITKAEENTYNVSATLFVKNGTFAENITADDITLGGAFEDATITALTKTQNTYILEFTFVKSNINLNMVSLEGSVIVAEGKVKNLWNTTLPQCGANLSYNKHGFALNGYREITALIPAQTGIFDKISTIGGYIGTVGSVASGVYTMLGLLGIVESTNAKIDNTREIVKDVQQAIAVLDEKLDKIDSTITAGTVETMSAVQYNTYITASGNWDHFIGSYVVPLQNEVNEFEMAYNDYMLNYIMNAHSVLHTVTVWKDVNGNVTLPHPANGTNSTWYSVEGDVLASIDAYNLTAELKGVQSKVMQNGGRLYDGYWEDITAEINEKQFESFFVDITKEEYLEAVQMNATLYALNTAGASDILNAFTSFCNALSGDGAAGGLKPLDNYLTMLSMYYNFYGESAKDIETTLTWLYSILTEGAFVATVAYNFTPSAQKDIVNNAFDKAAAQIDKASVEKDPLYSYVANKTLTATRIVQYHNNSTDGLWSSFETSLYVEEFGAENLLKDDTFKTGSYMNEVQVNLMFKRYEHLYATGICSEPSFRDYLIARGVLNSSDLYDENGNPIEAQIIVTPISLEEIPLDNSVEMEITKVRTSTWYTVGEVISIGSQGKVDRDYYSLHFRRRANTIDMEGNSTKDLEILSAAYYFEEHWYWYTFENWACIIVYTDPMYMFTLA